MPSERWERSNEYLNILSPAREKKGFANRCRFGTTLDVSNTVFMEISWLLEMVRRLIDFPWRDYHTVCGRECAAILMRAFLHIYDNLIRINGTELHDTVGTDTYATYWNEFCAAESGNDDDCVANNSEPFFCLLCSALPPIDGVWIRYEVFSSSLYSFFVLVTHSVRFRYAFAILEKKKKAKRKNPEMMTWKRKRIQQKWNNITNRIEWFTVIERKENETREWETNEREEKELAHWSEEMQLQFACDPFSFI